MSGAWLANDVALNSRDIDEAVKHINTFRATNGEEIHGFAWQSLRLLAYDDVDWLHPGQYDAMVTGKVAKFTHDWLAPKHALRICGPSFGLAFQSRDDCAHGVGHGMFYYYWHIGLAQKACWSDELTNVVPQLFAIDALRWRWLCSSGIYHSAGNTLSIAGFKQAEREGRSGQDFLCKRQPEWGDYDPHFERCVAGLGMEEVEFKKHIVSEGKCGDGGALAEWEVHQMQLTQYQRITCDPARWFGTALNLCPNAFWAYFPCIDHRSDFRICMEGVHKQCDSDQTWQTTFACGWGRRALGGLVDTTNTTNTTNVSSWPLKRKQ